MATSQGWACAPLGAGVPGSGPLFLSVCGACLYPCTPPDLDGRCLPYGQRRRAGRASGHPLPSPNTQFAQSPLGAWARLLQSLCAYPPGLEEWSQLLLTGPQGGGRCLTRREGVALSQAWLQGNPSPPRSSGPQPLRQTRPGAGAAVRVELDRQSQPPLPSPPPGPLLSLPAGSRLGSGTGIPSFLPGTATIQASACQNREGFRSHSLGARRMVT